MCEIKSKKYVNPLKIFDPFMKGKYLKDSSSYTSLSQKEKFWSNDKLGYTRIDSNEDFYKFYIENSNLGYVPFIYRGLKDAKYKMFTSLQVAYNVGDLKDLSYQERTRFVQTEIEHVRDNRCKYCKHNQMPCGLEDVDFLYLSFLQHFGLYTPCLDFSYNLDKALFFAQDKMEKSTHPDSDIDNYVSIYWIQPNQTDQKNHSGMAYTLTQFGVRPANELKNIIDYYRDSFQEVMPALNEALLKYKNIDTENIEPKNFYSWCNPRNNGEGLNKLSLGYFAENKYLETNSIKTFRELIDWLDFMKPQMAAGSLSENEFENYLDALYNSLGYNIRLSNTNLEAQEGCFIYFNPEDKAISLEDYWINNPTYLHLPTLHCVDIHKDIVVNYIRPLLEKKCINTRSIYPNGCDAAKQDMKLYLLRLKDKNS